MRDLIREELKLQGLTQQQLAKRLGYTQKHLSHIINGHTRLTVDMADRILGALGRIMVVTSVPNRGTQIPLTYRLK